MHIFIFLFLFYNQKTIIILLLEYHIYK